MLLVAALQRTHHRLGGEIVLRTSTAPAVGADIVGSGGKTDEIYRQIYTPGDPKWSH